MISYIIGFFLVIAYMAFPFVLKIIMFFANLYVPDSIPFIDEFIMFGGLVSHLNRLLAISEFYNRHKIISTLFVIGIIFILICLVVSIL